MTDFCAHPGCIHALSPGNVSGVCRGHMHGVACRCAWCRAPRQVKAGKVKRRVARLRIKSREELVAEGLLPGLEKTFPLTDLKGHR